VRAALRNICLVVGLATLAWVTVSVVFGSAIGVVLLLLHALYTLTGWPRIGL